MSDTRKQTYIAYRCPVCGEAVRGMVGQFALRANLIRLKCPCGGSAMDAEITQDGKLRLSVPCVFCKTNHSYVLPQSLFFGRDLFSLACPYANMDIGFIGEEEKIDGELTRTGKELSDLLRNLEAEKLSDIQPQPMEDDEILPDPEIYDIVRFLVKELEADGRIDCPCGGGRYDFRFTDGGVQVYCTDCGASYTFPAASVAAAREYLTTDELHLH